MVMDMNEAQVRTLEQVRQVRAGTQAMEFQAAADDAGRNAWIESVLERFDYRRLGRADRSPVPAYLQRLSGYSRAQITRLVSRWDGGKPLVKNYHPPRHPFARLYTAVDVALLADGDRAMGTLSGPTTACVLRRQGDVSDDKRFVRLGSISVGHPYNLRHSAGYRNQRVVLTKTRPNKNTPIGVRRAPAPEGRPGFIRIDSVHQGDLDGVKFRQKAIVVAPSRGHTSIAADDFRSVRNDELHRNDQGIGDGMRRGGDARHRCRSVRRHLTGFRSRLPGSLGLFVRTPDRRLVRK